MKTTDIEKMIEAGVQDFAWRPSQKEQPILARILSIEAPLPATSGRPFLKRFGVEISYMELNRRPARTVVRSQTILCAWDDLERHLQETGERGRATTLKAMYQKLLAERMLGIFEDLGILSEEDDSFNLIVKPTKESYNRLVYLMAILRPTKAASTPNAEALYAKLKKDFEE